MSGARADLGATDRRAYRAGPRLPKRGLDRLMPMHVWCGPTGHVLRAGPTLAKLRPGETLVGRRLLEVFELRRPTGVRSFSDLVGLDGAKLRVLFREPPCTALTGLLVALPGRQGALMNLSLGISVIEAVGRFGLKSKDFAPSDPTVDLIYLSEAQTAVLAESARLNSRLESARIAAEERAFTDTLTGLKNRRAMDHVLARLAAAGTGPGFGLMHLDLDHFKAVNDTHGHAAGDHVLQHVARILVEETCTGDLVARIGGDEFVILLRDCDDIATLEHIAARLVRRLARPIAFRGRTCRVSASIGGTLSRFYARPDAARMLSDADAALYVSKRRGRARHTLHGLKE